MHMLLARVYMHAIGPCSPCLSATAHPTPCSSAIFCMQAVFHWHNRTCSRVLQCQPVHHAWCKFASGVSTMNVVKSPNSLGSDSFQFVIAITHIVYKYRDTHDQKSTWVDVWQPNRHKLRHDKQFYIRCAATVTKTSMAMWTPAGSLGPGWHTVRVLLQAGTSTQPQTVWGELLSDCQGRVAPKRKEKKWLCLSAST